MDLKHSFTVNQPMAETWQVLTDLERITPCLPGAQLQEVHGDVYKGVVKIKVGPITAQFKGDAQFAELDHTNFKATLKASGRDTGGKGNASATITAELVPVSDRQTTCNVVTDLSITGKVAQFGRGAMADISDKLLAQFVDNLNGLIADAPSTPATAPSPATDATDGVRTIDAPEAAPIDLLATAGTPILKRAIPVLVVAAVIVVWLVVR